MDKKEKKKAFILLVVLFALLVGGAAFAAGMMKEKEQPGTDNVSLSVKNDAETDCESGEEELDVLDTSSESMRMREEKVGELDGDFGNIWSVGEQQMILTMREGFAVWSLEDASLQSEPDCSFPEGGFAWYAFLDADGNIWCLWQIEGQESPVLIQYDADTGNMLSEIALMEDGIQLRQENVRKMYADSEWIYLINRAETDQFELAVFDHNGELSCVKDDVMDMEWLENGRLLIYCSKTGSRLLEVDIENGEIKEKSKKTIELLGRASMIHSAADGKTVYLLTGDEITGVSMEEENAQPEKLMSFLGDALEISGDYMARDFFAEKTGTVYVVYDVFGGEKIGKEIWRYEAVEQQERERVLTVSVAYPMAILDAAVKVYEQKYPDRQVKLETAYKSLEEYQEYSDGYTESMAVRLMTGDYGDVLLSSHGIYGWDMLAGDAFEDLSDWIAGTENYENLNQNIIEAVKVEGRLNGVPVALSHSYYVANREQVVEADQNGDGKLTWSELLNQAVSWEENETGYYIFGTAAEAELGNMLASNIFDLIDPGKKTVELRQEWFLELMKLFKQVHQLSALSAPQMAYDPDESHVLFIGLDRGATLTEVAQFSRGRSMGSLEKDALSFYEDEAACECEFMRLKGIDGERNANYSDFPMLFFSLNPAAKERQAALDFLEVLLSEEVQRRLEYNLIPVSAGARRDRLEQAKKSGVPLTDGELERFYEDTEEMLGQIEWLYSYGYYLNDLGEAMQSYVDGRLELEDAVAQAEQKIWIRMNE